VALAGYEAARAYFLDPRVALYSVYLFDDGRGCRELPHRFFASVNGDMIWSGLELYRDTGQSAYLDQATATAAAVERDLSDDRGVFVDLQAENDVVEPLVEAMDALARTGQGAARHWLLSNAGAALSARTAGGSYGLFDGPPPATTVTAWQTNGRLALGIALLGTLGERYCERGHSRVLVDGRETFDRSGIWQNKSSVRRSIAGTVPFAWRWRTPGRHTLTFLPGSENQEEGGPFLHLAGYRVLKHG
jgi:hypothetical protein